MDNVPSSAVLLTISIVVTCVIASFGFLMYQSTNSVTGTVVNSHQKVEGKLENTIFTKYDGITLRGSGVIRAIKLLRDDDVAVLVENMNAAGNATDTYYSYIYNAKDSETGGDVTKSTTYAENTDSKDSSFTEDYEKAKFSSKNASNYIPQDQQYIGKVITNQSGAVTVVMFYLR